MSSADLVDWMEENYFPLHCAVGDGESFHTARAMHTIMNAIEHARPDDMDCDEFETAIEFLDAPEREFASTESRFLCSCFRSNRESGPPG